MVDLLDQYRMRIDEEYIEIVQQFKNCSNFYLEVVVPDKTLNIDVVEEVYDKN